MAHLYTNTNLQYFYSVPGFYPGHIIALHVSYLLRLLLAVTITQTFLILMTLKILRSTCQTFCGKFSHCDLSGVSLMVYPCLSVFEKTMKAKCILSRVQSINMIYQCWPSPPGCCLTDFSIVKLDYFFSLFVLYSLEWSHYAKPIIKWKNCSNSLRLKYLH